MRKQTIKYLFLILMLPLSSFAQDGQVGRVKDNSPYSRLGMGDLFDQNFSAIRAMGGQSAAFHDGYQVNLVNPASLGFLEATSFEVGLYSQYSQLTDGNTNVGVTSGNLGYLSLGFITQNKLNEILDRKIRPWAWAMNFSLTPYSDVNYGVELNSALVDSTQVVNFFSGNGGTYRFMWGNAYRYKHFSVGLNLGYIFGKIDNERSLTVDAQPAYGIITEKSTSINGFTWNLGVQYNHIFKKTTNDGEVPTGRILTLGVYGNSVTGFDTNSGLLEFRTNNTFFHRDTITNTSELRQKGQLPAEFGLGLMLKQTNKWKLGANFKYAQWSKYENEGLVDGQNLNDTWELGIGGEMTPDFKSYNSYAKKIRYRGGVYFGKDPRLNLSDYGVTFGVGLPIILPRQTISFVNLSLEVGQLKDLSSIAKANSISETYVNLTAGFTLNDNTWFFKRKFN